MDSKLMSDITPDEFETAGTQDGTYRVDALGFPILIRVTHGYIVAKRALDHQTPFIPGQLVGRWEDTETGTLYWDEVEVIESRLDAGNIARQRGELAVWDNLNNCEMRV